MTHPLRLFAASALVAPWLLAAAPVGTPVAGIPLVSMDGGTTTVSAYRGRWVWLYFGFTNCGGACPTALQEVAKALDKTKHGDRVKPLFVSVDPVRDNPGQITRFVRNFHPAIAGATGSRKVLDVITKSVGAEYFLSPIARPNISYGVGHPNKIYVIDPAGKLAGVIDAELADTAKRLVADLDRRVVAEPKAIQLASPTPAPQPSPDVRPTPLPIPSAGPSAVPTPLATGTPPPISTSEAWCGPAGASEPEALMARAATLGSGTGVLPASSPMRMWWTPVGDWLWMFHGDLVGGYNVQGGPRGDLTWAAENWQMAMGTRPLGPGLLDLRLMTSLENWTLPPGGTPQLFQMGETYQGGYLIDRQHPHDLIGELAARYTWNVSPDAALFAYGGLAGEPALGPVAFMHRPSSADNHWSPLGHHFQDSTHTAYGVLTSGVRLGEFQAEGSVFNGKEPDENRVGLDLAPLSSYSGRLSWFPGRNVVFQLSRGHLVEPEATHPGDQDRLSASMMAVNPTPLGRWSSSLIWGQVTELPTALSSQLISQSYGFENQLDWADRNHAYMRFELLDRAGLPPLPPGSHIQVRLNALTLGMSRDLGDVNDVAVAIGGDVTAYSLDSFTRPAYGNNPYAFRVYLRLRPPTMGGDNPDGDMKMDH